jgi:predicted nucleic acid-binding protein
MARTLAHFPSLRRENRAGPWRTVPATDLLIAACARAHGAALEQADGDFDLLAGVAASKR